MNYAITEAPVRNTQIPKGPEPRNPDAIGSRLEQLTENLLRAKSEIQQAAGKFAPTVCDSKPEAPIDGSSLEGKLNILYSITEELTDLAREVNRKL